MGWLEEVMKDAQSYARPEVDPGYIWDDFLAVCAPFTVLDASRGYLGRGMTDYGGR